MSKNYSHVSGKSPKTNNFDENTYWSISSLIVACNSHSRGNASARRVLIASRNNQPIVFGPRSWRCVHDALLSPGWQRDIYVFDLMFTNDFFHDWANKNQTFFFFFNKSYITLECTELQRCMTCIWNTWRLNWVLRWNSWFYQSILVHQKYPIR